MEIQKLKISKEDRLLVSIFIGEDYPFEIDFNWLMPVVIKIRGISYYDFNYQWNLVSEAVLTFKIELVWEEVVDFIKWHSQYINQKA